MYFQWKVKTKHIFQFVDWKEVDRTAESQKITEQKNLKQKMKIP